MRLNDADKTAIETRVAAFEQATGAQAVISVVGRCDSYPEVPWKAFALGASLAALLLWAVPFADALLYHSTTLALAAVLGAGAVAALLAVFLPAAGRWLLPAERRETELRQYAQAMFLTRELFATQERSALLILAGLYERRAVILADRGLSRRLPAGWLQAVEAELNTALRRDAVAGAIQASLTLMEKQLQRPGAVPAAGNEIADSVIRERGH